MSASSFCLFWEKFSLILFLNVFGLLSDFLSQMEDLSIFSALGKISIFVQKYFCKMEILM